MADIKEYIDPNQISDITFLDFETTGLKEPAPVSLALIRVENYKIKYAKYFLINPEKEIEYGAFLIHKITQDMVCDKPNFAQIWNDIKNDISSQIICGHNIRFDSGTIQKQIQRYNLNCSSYKTICTCDNSKRFISKDKIKNYKLDTVCNYFNINCGIHHDARDDTNSARLIFNKLKKLGQLEIKTITI